MTLEASFDTKRFCPSRDSMSKFQELRSLLTEIQKTYSWIKGFSFFGSRAKGNDRTGSDIDLCIFYDPTQTDPENISYENWWTVIKSISNSVSAPLDHRLAVSSGGMRINLSEERTVFDLQQFIRVANVYIDQYGLENLNLSKLLNTIGIPPTQNLYARFFLGVGEEVYRNRQFIIEYLERQDYGEIYFQILMSCLRYFENTSKRNDVADRTIDSLPKSIAEAKRYFILRKTREIFQPT